MLDRPTLLDGGMGATLIERGLPPGALPEEWLLARPGEISAVHSEHAAAGAEVVLTCTFNCAAPRLAPRVGGARVEDLCARAAALARAAAPDALLAGAVGPTGLHAPGAATDEELLGWYRRPLSALAAAGADLLWIESQWALREALLALRAARETGLPAVVTFGLPERGGAFRGPEGARAEDSLGAVAAEGALAAGLNCMAPGPSLTALAAWAASSLGVPFVAKPSPGLPGAVLAPGPFAAAVAPAVDAGLRILGGCCGARGAHVAALGELIARLR